MHWVQFYYFVYSFLLFRLLFVYFQCGDYALCQFDLSILPVLFSMSQRLIYWDVCMLQIFRVLIFHLSALVYEKTVIVSTIDCTLYPISTGVLPRMQHLESKSSHQLLETIFKIVTKISEKFIVFFNHLFNHLPLIL